MAGPTPAGALNQDLTLNADTVYLLRVRVENTGTTGGTGFIWQYSHQGGAFTAITTTSTVVRAVPATTFVDNADVPEVLGGIFPSVTEVLPQQFSTATTSHSVNLPTTVSSGELLLLFFSANSDAEVITDPAGWTRLYGGTAGAGGLGVTGVGLAKVATGTEGGTSVNVQTAGTEAAAAQVYRISGWSGAVSFAEEWTGTNGSAWDSGRWPTIGVISTSVVDIQSNQGQLLPQGAAFAYGRALSAGGTFSNLDLTAKFTLGTIGEQYHTLIVRGSSSWSTADPASPTNGYRIVIWNDGVAGFLSLGTVVAEARTTLVNVSKTWGTSQWNLRIQAIGSTIRVKAWQGSEPGSWDIEHTNTNHSSGIVSLSSQNGNAITARPITWDDLLVVPVIGGVDAGIVVQSAAAATTHNPPSVTASWGSAKNLFIEVLHAGDDDVALTSASANYTNALSTLSGAGANNGAAVYTARRELDAASDDPGVMTLASTEDGVANTIVVRPGSGNYLVDNDAGSEDGTTTLPVAFPAGGAIEFVLAFQLRSAAVGIATGQQGQIRLALTGGTALNNYTQIFDYTVNIVVPSGDFTGTPPNGTLAMPASHGLWGTGEPWSDGRRFDDGQGWVPESIIAGLLPTTGFMTTATFLAIVSRSQSLAIPLATLSATGLAPVVGSTSAFQGIPITAALNTTPRTVTITFGAVVAPAASARTMSGVTPIISGSSQIAVAVGAAAAIGRQPIVASGTKTADTAVGGLSISGHAPEVFEGSDFPADIDYNIVGSVTQNAAIAGSAQVGMALAGSGLIIAPIVGHAQTAALTIQGSMTAESLP